MNLFRRVFGGGSDEDEPASMPWDRRPSLLEYVRAHCIAEKPGLAEGGYSLPDENLDGSKLRWAPGAMDGVMTHHSANSADEETVRRLAGQVATYSREPTAENKAAVYRTIVEEKAVALIDPVIEALVNDEGINHERLYELAHSFVTESSDREPLKFGIAILGLYRIPENEEIFQTLGRHDEFTLFCVVAISNIVENVEQSLWALGRNATGWGRIHVVERLAPIVSDSAIRQWLLRQGYRNDVMYEYLAVTCARAGGLLDALNNERADRELLTSAGEIIQAMIAGGPVEGIDHYEEGRPVIESFVRQMESSAETIDDFLHVTSVKGYLDDDESTWAQRFEAGWTGDLRDRLRSRCDSILRRPDWSDRVQTGLTSQDESAFARASQAASALGIDTWDIHWKRLVENPIAPARWQPVTAQCDADRIGRTIEFAESHLDLSRIATGVADEMGLGPGFARHSCLDNILQELPRFPGQGATLIQTGLKSPVVRNRNLAVAALAAWPRADWPQGFEQLLEETARQEPNEGVRERIRKVLHGEPLTD